MLLSTQDVHAGYGFAIGNVAAFDMGDPAAVVSPGGVGCYNPSRTLRRRLDWFLAT